MEVVTDGVSRQKPTGLYKHHVWHWANVKHANNKVLSKVIGEEGNFNFSPHMYTPGGISKVSYSKNRAGSQLGALRGNPSKSSDPFGDRCTHPDRYKNIVGGRCSDLQPQSFLRELRYNQGAIRISMT